VHDWRVFEDLIDGIEPIKRPRGRPRKRPEKLHADKAYDDKKCARALSKRAIKRRIARKGMEGSEKLGRHRGGSWSGGWLGSPNTAGSRSVTSAETIYMRRSYVSRLFSDLPQLPLMSGFERLTMLVSARPHLASFLETSLKRVYLGEND